MTVTDDQPKGPVRAWSFEYANEARPGETALTVIRHPRAAWVYSREVDARTLLADDASPVSETDGFTFIFVQSGSATVYELQKQTERWMARRPREQEGILEVLFRSERLLWRPGRAICFGTPSFIEDMLVASAHFSLCETELQKFEQQAEDAWHTIETTDIDLTDRIRWRTLNRRVHVDEMMRKATIMQARYLRLEKAMEAPSAEFSGPARRVFTELTLLASTENRLMRLDDAVDGLSDHYKFVNERFSDYWHFLREHRIVVLIVIVLLIQTVVLSENFWRPWLDQLNSTSTSAPAPTPAPAPAPTPSPGSR
jgi:hypothetical protein